MEEIDYYGNAAIAQILIKAGGQKDGCYVLSLIRGYDGVFLPLNEALDRVIGNGFATIVYCHNGVAYFEAEQVQGPPPRFILKA